MANTRTLIAADHLTKQYGSVVALDDISFTISEGITGILGENGAGKSTAIKILLGLVAPASGSATVLGENASENVVVRSRLGYMPEHDCLPGHVSAAEFLTHMAEVSGLPPSTARTRAADTLRHPPHRAWRTRCTRRPRAASRWPRRAPAPHEAVARRTAAPAAQRQRP
jgi:ABC-2 type transport system ATP-binding protein